MSTDAPILTISVAAKLLSLHPRTLMLYEKNKLIKPSRTNTNRRLYAIKDLELLQFIKYLTQTEGVNLKGAKLLLDAIRLGEQEGITMRKLLFPSFILEQLIGI